MCSSPPKVELVQRWRGVNSLNGAPCSHHPALGAKGSAISYHEDMPSPELADRALVDADAAESSAYESTFSRAVELAVEERHKRPLVERGGMGAEVLVVGSERHGISSSLYGGRGDDDVRDGLRHRSRVWPASFRCAEGPLGRGRRRRDGVGPARHGHGDGPPAITAGAVRPRSPSATGRQQRRCARTALLASVRPSPRAIRTVSLAQRPASAAWRVEYDARRRFAASARSRWQRRRSTTR
jgi:hypothetical protein